MADELTSAGLSIDDYETRRAAVVTELRSAISSILDVSPDQPTGQLVDIFLERLQASIELLQTIYDAMDPDQATRQSLDAVSSITGTYRREATKGTVGLELTFSGSGTASAGDVVAVSGDPDNQWILDADVTAAAAGTETGTATAAEAGVYEAPANSITVIISTSEPNWTGVDNPSPATPGQAEETDTELRLRRELEVTVAGSTSLDSIIAAVSALDDVLQVDGIENDTAHAASGLPPSSFEIIYWGGSTPPSGLAAEVAETILKTKAAGVQSYGSDSETVTTQSGDHVVGLTEAAEQVIELRYTLVTDDDYPADSDFAATVAALSSEYQGVGDDVLHSRWIWAAFTVAGVVNVTQLEMRVSGGAWGTSDISIAQREIATVDSSNVMVV